MVDISVLLPVFDTEMLATQLLAVTEQTTAFTWELVVIDRETSAAATQIVERLMASDSRVRRISLPGRRRPTQLRNIGVRSTVGTSIVFCGVDDVAGEGWLDAMATALAKTPLVAGRLDYRRLNGADVWRGPDQPQSRKLEVLFGYAVVNGAIGVHRDLWESLRGVDERFGAFGADLDFTIRAQRYLGIKPKLAADAICHHRRGTGLVATWLRCAHQGSASVRLYDRYGRGRVDRTAERRSARHDWWWIMTRSPLLVARHNRSRWMRTAGLRSGRLFGSVRERTFYP